MLLDQGSVAETDLLKQVSQALDQVPEGNRVVGEDELPLEVTRAITGLEARQIVRNEAGTWVICEGHEATVRFYANSIAHFFDTNAAIAK